MARKTPHMEQSNTEYTRELEKLIQEVLLPGYLKVCEKHQEPFPWKDIPTHLVAGIQQQPKPLARLLQAAFRV